MQVGRDRLPEGEDAGRGGIAMVPVAQSLDGCFDDVRRGREIGLPDAEIDDVAAAPRELGRAGEHCKGVLFADTAESRRGEAWRFQVPGLVIARIETDLPHRVKPFREAWRQPCVRRWKKPTQGA